MVGLPFTLWLIKKHTGAIKLRDFAGQHFRLLVASIAVMFPLFLLVRYLDWVGVSLTKVTRLGELTVIMIASLIGYMLVAKVSGVEEITMLRNLKTSFMRRSESNE